TRLVYRPKRSTYDFVLPRSADRAHDFAALTKLCEKYQAASLVAECEISYDLLTRDKTPDGTAMGDGAACPLTPTHGAPLLKDGTLSPFWAQEYIGSDLVAFPRNAARMGFAVQVAVIDQNFGDDP